MKRLVLTFSFLTLFLSGCTSTPAQNFQRLRVGMDKADVLEIMGNPTHTSRQHGADRWTYEYEENGTMVRQFVFFNEGRVTYVGAPPEKTEKPKPQEFRPVGEGEGEQ